MIDATVKVEGLREALRDLSAMDGHARGGLKRALWRMGALVKKTAVRYAPISPSTGMLKRFLRRGAIAGDRVTLKATKRRGVTEVMLTKFYADRLKTDFYGFGNPRSTTLPKPGGLMRSITLHATENQAEIFVPVNSEAGKYAFRIHEEFGKTWFHRGPGTQAKGAQAGAKFIERAVTDNGRELVRIAEDEMDRALVRALRVGKS